MEIFNFKFLRNIMSSIVKENLILNFEAKKDQGSFWSDKSGQQNKGVFVGSPTYCPENKGSYSFNGNGQYVRLPQDFIDVTKSFSSVFVFKTKTPGLIFGQTAIPDFDAATGYVPALYVDNNGKLRTSFFWNESVAPATSEVSVNDDKIHVVIVVFENNIQKTYLDGVLISSTEMKQNPYSNKYFYYVGGGKIVNWEFAPSTNFFVGNIYNVAFYNKALTEEEVAKNYKALKR